MVDFDDEMAIVAVAERWGISPAYGDDGRLTLLTDGNAIFALLDAVKAAGWNWDLRQWGEELRCYLWRHHSPLDDIDGPDSDTPHEAVIAAIHQIPEAE